MSDLIKIDVEGWELFVLRGGAAMLRRDRPHVLLEAEEANMAQANVTHQQLQKEIDGLGYVCDTVGADNRWCHHRRYPLDPVLAQLLRRYRVGQ